MGIGGGVARGQGGRRTGAGLTEGCPPPISSFGKPVNADAPGGRGRLAAAEPVVGQVFCTTMLGNLLLMSLAFSAICTATLRAMAR